MKRLFKLLVCIIAFNIVTMTFSNIIKVQAAEPMIIIDDSDIQSIDYYGDNWKSAVNSTDQHGTTEHWVDVKNNPEADHYYKISFTGTKIRLYANKAPAIGSYDIYIDDVLKTTVSARESTRKVKQLIYESEMLTNGNHTAKVMANKENKGNIQFDYAEIEQSEVQNESVFIESVGFVSEPNGEFQIGFKNLEKASDFTAADMVFCYDPSILELEESLISSDYGNIKMSIIEDGKVRLVVSSREGLDENFRIKVKMSVVGNIEDTTVNLINVKIADKEGKIKELNEASFDMVLTSYYNKTKETLPSSALTKIICTKRADGKTDIKFVAQLVIPEGYTLEEAGLVWSNKGANYNNETLLDIANYSTDSGVKLTKISRISNTWQYSVTIKGVPGTVECVPGRAYAKLVKADEEAKTVQSAVKTGYTK